MSPRKSLLEAVTTTLYNTSHCLRNCPPVKTALHYGSYLGYLSHNWAPRVSYVETTTPAYTLARNSYSVYFVYSLIAGFAVHQVVLDNEAEAQAKAHYLAVRD